MDRREPRTYGEKKRRLKAIQDEWGKRLLAARGQGDEGYVSPSTLSYGHLVYEYCYARDRSRWYRGFGQKPHRYD